VPDWFRPAVVTKNAAAIAIGSPYPNFKAIALDASTLDSYAGDYKLNEKSVRTVRREKDHLEVVRAGRASQAIYASDGNRFFTKNALTVFRFERNPAGVIDRLVLDDDGIEQVHARMK
jgi:hypothetical protein